MESMTFEEYMQLRMGSPKNGSALTIFESNLFKIDIKKKRWRKQNTNKIITCEMLDKIKQYNEKCTPKNKYLQKLCILISPSYNKSKTNTYSKNDQLIYLMENSNGLLKIGISINPHRRAQELTHASGYKIKILALWNVDKMAMEIEKKLHYHFRQSRTYGEWFNPDFGIYHIEMQLKLISKFDRIKL